MATLFFRKDHPIERGARIPLGAALVGLAFG
jgi:hypothetical protein